jgi:hypothetical protein
LCDVAGETSWTLDIDAERLRESIGSNAAFAPRTQRRPNDLATRDECELVAQHEAGIMAPDARETIARFRRRAARRQSRLA